MSMGATKRISSMEVSHCSAANVIWENSDRFDLICNPGNASAAPSDLVTRVPHRDEEGFSNCSACPCHRAVASTPARNVPERETDATEEDGNAGRRSGFSAAIVFLLFTNAAEVGVCAIVATAHCERAT
jgi:hypothetical protein